MADEDKCVGGFSLRVRVIDQANPAAGNHEARQSPRIGNMGQGFLSINTHPGQVTVGPFQENSIDNSLTEPHSKSSRIIFNAGTDRERKNISGLVMAFIFPGIGIDGFSQSQDGIHGRGNPVNNRFGVKADYNDQNAGRK